MTNMPMKTHRIGKTSVSVTTLGFGTSPLGNLYRAISDEHAEKALDAAWENGLRYFDTAPFYGLGLSETRVGQFLSSKNRDSYQLSTKVGRLLHPAIPAAQRYDFVNPLPNDITYDYSYDGVMRSVEASLKRLGTGSVDIILMHDIGELTHGKQNSHHFPIAMSGGYRAMGDLRSQGVVKAIGLGVNEIAVCLAAMEHGFWDCFLLAGRYTLLEQGGLADFLPKCRENGSSVIVGGAYNSGILATGTKKAGTIYYDYGPAPDDIVARVRRIEEVCGRHSVHLAAAALQFPLAHPAVCCVIPGMGSPDRIAQTLRNFNATIPNEFWQELRSEGLLSPDCPVPGTVRTT